jgi:hypothetical protein
VGLIGRSEDGHRHHPEEHSQENAGIEQAHPSVPGANANANESSDTNRTRARWPWSSGQLGGLARTRTFAARASAPQARALAFGQERLKPRGHAAELGVGFEAGLDERVSSLASPAK